MWSISFGMDPTVPDQTAEREAHPGPGRPRGFDLDAAIDAGVAVIRRDGYEAASLDALTRAMGISRSSFYAAFGSKRGVLLAALGRYSRERLRVMAAIGEGGLVALLGAIAGLGSDSHGCLMVNCVVELAPRDPEIAALGAAHLRRVEAIVADRLPSPRRDAAPALVAVALGAQTLLKSGAAPQGVADLVALAARRMG